MIVRPRVPRDGELAEDLEALRIEFFGAVSAAIFLLYLMLCHNIEQPFTSQYTPFGHGHTAQSLELVRA